MLRQALHDRFVITAGRGAARLDRRHVYILPSRHGLTLGAVLAVMLLGAINYGNSMAYALTFLLGGMGLTAMLHTYRNLAGIVVRPGRVEPVFAGQRAEFNLLLAAPGERPAISVEAGEGRAMELDLAAGEETVAVVRVAAPRRGLQPLGRIRLSSEFPLGIFHTWSWVELESNCLVYPTPETAAPPLPETGDVGSSSGGARSGDDDFSGLRAYVTGESLQHVAWKAVAQGRGMHTKQFEGNAGGGTVWIEWQAAAPLESEARLSRLCRWVLEAEAAGRAYGLRLPGVELAPAHGEAHRRRCLEALALF